MSATSDARNRAAQPSIRGLHVDFQDSDFIAPEPPRSAPKRRMPRHDQIAADIAEALKDANAATARTGNAADGHRMFIGWALSKIRALSGQAHQVESALLAELQHAVDHASPSYFAAGHADSARTRFGIVPQRFN